MKRNLFISILLLSVILLNSCSLLPTNKKLLNSDDPITISVWNYYNGTVKVRFDELVAQFNETVGAEKGIVIEAQSYGDVTELADAVYEASNNSIGALPMPDIFASYADNAFRISDSARLVNLSDYFTKEELSEIKKEFLSEGIWGKEQTLKILPVAKSTEILFLNKTFWEDFAAETGASLDTLKTWEGLVQTAKLYYEHTGKAFFRIDAVANFMLISAMQLGEEFYQYDDDIASLNFSQDTAYRIWVNYYVPYLNGYFAKSGRFSSDDAKTGIIAGYTGSTASASYFPEEVACEDIVAPIEVLTLPYPYYENSKPYVVQQGAGMCITKSDKAHEYAASVFLKWFIDMPQNIDFAVSTAYLPVKSQSLTANALMKTSNYEEISNAAVKSSIETTINMLSTHTLYGNKPFTNSFQLRSILENHLYTRVETDLALLEKRIINGEDRTTVIKELCSKEHFSSWYQAFTNELQTVLRTSK